MVPQVCSKCSLFPTPFSHSLTHIFFSPSRQKPSFRLQYTFTSLLSFLKVFHHRPIANRVSNISLHNKMLKGTPTWLIHPFGIKYAIVCTVIQRRRSYRKSRSILILLLSKFTRFGYFRRRQIESRFFQLPSNTTQRRILKRKIIMRKKNNFYLHIKKLLYRLNRIFICIDQFRF